VIPPKDPLMETETSKKIKVSPKKPSVWKNSCTNKPHLQTTLTVDDIDLIIIDVSDTSEDIFQRSEAKQEKMYDKIEVELKGVHQALYSSHTVSTASLTVGGIEVGDEPAQLCRIEDAIEAHLRQV
jgi:hypothetical protein